ncbi:MAG: hypothetical protein HQL94_09680 [Magnetococcales bacterium]|nr:hypothetical protein [Magnetococcales bacterium]MBF0438565.1 hypothetical protein [Magnetococcales bacterium]
MDSIEVEKIKPGQSVTLDFGNKEPILTRMEAPRQFKLEDWYPEERIIYLLDEVIAEDEPLRYSFDQNVTIDALKTDQKAFGQQRKIGDFLGRVVAGIEMEEEEEEEEEEEA